MFRFGAGELLLTFSIILLLFGARRIPELGKALGQSLKEFKKAGKTVPGEIPERGEG